MLYYIERGYLHLDPGSFWPLVGSYVASVGMVEEAAKLFFATTLVEKYSFRRGSDPGPLATALVTAGLGFGMGEAIWYFITKHGPNSYTYDFIFWRAIPLPLAHASWALLNGMFCRFRNTCPFESPSVWIGTLC